MARAHEPLSSLAEQATSGRVHRQRMASDVVEYVLRIAVRRD